MFTKPLESTTRIKINNWLANLGWIIDENNPQCNCYTERARTIEENRKFAGKKPDYVLYSSSDLQPIAIIEAKRQGENLTKALKQAIDKYATPPSVSG